jgi:DNA repair protein SbcC/Rad50
MRLNRLRVSNFRQHIDTQIDFDAGISGIIGPNGSGKSTLLEAIAWALYGTPAARGTRDSIRSYRAAPRAQVRVELDFDLGGHRYLVSRGLTNAELFLDGSSVPIATSISAVNDLLRRRLGMTHDEFFHTYFTGQKELGIMAAMGASERAQFLSRVLGYERLKTAQELIRKRRSALDAEIKGLRAGMPDPIVVQRALGEARDRVAAADAVVVAAGERRDRARAAAAEVAPHWDRLQRERDLDLSLAAELRVAEGERDGRQRDGDRIQRELAEIALARQALEALTAELATLSGLETELRELERACNEQARHQTLSDTLRAISDEVSALTERRDRIATAPSVEAEAAADLTRMRGEFEQVLAQFETAQTDWVRDRQEAETKREALVGQLKDAQQQRDQIVTLGEGGICPICSRPLETHFRSVLELLDAQIETITFDGKYYRSRIDQLAVMPPEVAALDERRRQLPDQLAKLERRLANAQSAVHEMTVLVRDLEAKERRRDGLALELSAIAVRYDAARHADVRASVERLTPLSAQAARLATQIERERPLTEEGERVRRARVDVDARVAGLVERRLAVAFSEQVYATTRDAYERAAAALREAELAAVAVDAEVAAARTSLASADQARADLERAEARLAELTTERRLHDELDRAFGDIRTDLNQELRPELSDRASRYIRELTDGRYAELELDEQYNIIVLEDAIPKPVISGGEEDLANLVLRLAISEMIAERAGQPFSLLILDEVFGSLDETRRHNVVDLLRRLQDRFEQVILITHIESVREGLDRVVTVRYDEESGTSTVDTETLAMPAASSFDVHVGAAD